MMPIGRAEGTYIDSLYDLCYCQRAICSETGSHLDSEGRRQQIPGRRNDGSILAERRSQSMRKVMTAVLFGLPMFVAASVSWGQTVSTEATWESATWETL